MEDSVAMVQDLGVSCKVPVSCYCVFDGHNGDECVKYISQNLLDNLRESILKR
jgi:serine/threonine protein phosphatase PrpC